MQLSIIVAIANNNVIGKNNDLVCRMPADMSYFKEKTMGHAIIMGRKNYESIGRALPGRTSIILSRNKELKIEDCKVVNSLFSAFALADKDSEAFVIGGGEIYKMALPLTTKLYVTRIYAELPGDVFFPEIDMERWEEVSAKHFLADEKNPYDYSFFEYLKK